MTFLRQSPESSGGSLRRWAGRSVCLLFLVVMTGLMGHSVWKSIVPWGFPNGDAAWYLATGRLLTEGHLPYRDLHDHKPPLIHFINAAGFVICPNSPFGAQMIFLALFGAAVMIWWRLFLRLGVPASVTPLLVVAAFGALLTTNQQWFLMSESQAFIFTSFALYCAIRGGAIRWSILAGVFIALASLSKQQMVYDGFALAVLLGITNERVTPRRLAAGILGGCLIYGVTIAVLFWMGIARETWECFLYNFEYIGGRYTFWGQFKNAGTLGFLVPAGLFAMGWVMSLNRYSMRRCGVTRWLLGRFGLLVWFVAVLSASAWGQSHYAILTWAAALFSFGLGCRELVRWCPDKAVWPFDRLIGTVTAIRRHVSPVLLWSGVATVVLCAFLVGARLYPRYYYVTPVVGKLNRMFSGSTSAFVFTGEGGRYWQALRMTPTTRYSCMTGLAENTRLYETVIPKIMESLGKTPPDVLIFDNQMNPHYQNSEGLRMLKGLLSAYVQERQYERLDMGDPNFDVYVAKMISRPAHRWWDRLNKQLNQSGQ